MVDIAHGLIAPVLQKRQGTLRQASMGVGEGSRRFRPSGTCPFSFLHDTHELDVAHCLFVIELQKRQGTFRQAFIGAEEGENSPSASGICRHSPGKCCDVIRTACRGSVVRGVHDDAARFDDLWRDLGRKVCWACAGEPVYSDQAGP